MPGGRIPASPLFVDQFAVNATLSFQPIFLLTHVSETALSAAVFANTVWMSCSSRMVCV